MNLLLRSVWVGLLCCAANSASAEVNDEWAATIGATSRETFKSSSAEEVPGYDASYSNTITASNIGPESTIDAQTDEGAEVIYGLGGRPDVSDDSWYQDAIDITQDPTSVYDMQDGEYSDCSTATTPGDTYTKEQSCTETALPETTSCSVGRKLEVDSHHLYECKSERDTTNGACGVGREINVNEAAAYRCDKGETSYVKTCNKKLNITVDNHCESGQLEGGICVKKENSCKYKFTPVSRWNPPSAYAEDIYYVDIYFDSECGGGICRSMCIVNNQVVSCNGYTKGKYRDHESGPEPDRDWLEVYELCKDEYEESQPVSTVTEEWAEEDCNE